MSKKSRQVGSLLNNPFNPGFDIRIQAFYLITYCGIVAGLLGAIGTYFARSGFINCMIDLVMFGVSLGILLFATRTGRYQHCFYFMVIFLLIIVFPLVFFIAGGYKSGMPCLYFLAVVFTTIMLDGKICAVFLTIEIFIYSVSIGIAYFVPESIGYFDRARVSYLDVFMGVTIVCVALLFVMRQYIHIYTDREKKLAELDKLKSEFFQDMHHEMKTPLAVIISDINNADDMLSYNMDKTIIREKLEHAQDEIMRLARMVEYSLDLSSAREKDRSMEWINFASLLKRSTKSFRSLLANNGNTLMLDIPGKAIPPIYANQDMLRQVVSNLLFNAYKYTENGEIKVSLKQDVAGLITSVKDNGKGILPEILEHIGERGASTGGTGYGLSICKGIVEMHGGELWVESEYGKGTIVYFSLPY